MNDEGHLPAAYQLIRHYANSDLSGNRGSGRKAL